MKKLRRGIILASLGVMSVGYAATDYPIRPVPFTAGGADEVYKANPRPPTDGLVGANYTAAYAVNQVRFWHDFRADVIDKEMAAARPTKATYPKKKSPYKPDKQSDAR